MFNPAPSAEPSVILQQRRVLEVIDVVACIAYILLAFGVSYTLAFGPARLHDSNAVELIRGLGVSWPAISIMFGFCGLLLCSRYTRVAGWLLGTVLYGYYLISAFQSIVIQGNAGSAFALAVAIAAVFSQVSGLTRSIVAAEWRNEGAD